MVNSLQYLFQVFIYGALGLATHLWLVGPVVWASAKVYVYMALWPFILILQFVVWAVAIVIILAIVAVIADKLGII